MRVGECFRDSFQDLRGIDFSVWLLGSSAGDRVPVQTAAEGAVAEDGHAQKHFGGLRERQAENHQVGRHRRPHVHRVCPSLYGQ